MRPTDPRFAAWLLDETGIDAESLGANALARAVGARAAATVSEPEADFEPHAPTRPVPRNEWAHGLALPEWAREAYWQHLTTTATERQALIDSLVVPETWFFREREAFAALARLGAKRLAAQPGEVLRVLSVPCSSGEEPYSAAMALLDAGLAHEQSPSTRSTSARSPSQRRRAACMAVTRFGATASRFASAISRRGPTAGASPGRCGAR
jgi:chemotaxis protein methyltransferase WspC